MGSEVVKRMPIGLAGGGESFTENGTDEVMRGILDKSH